LKNKFVVSEKGVILYEINNWRIVGIKKAEKLSQYFGPTSTYEKQPFKKGNKLNSNAMPVNKNILIKALTRLTHEKKTNSL
jgi:hypothetical protein